MTSVTALPTLRCLISPTATSGRRVPSPVTNQPPKEYVVGSVATEIGSTRRVATLAIRMRAFREFDTR